MQGGRSYQALQIIPACPVGIGRPKLSKHIILKPCLSHRYRAAEYALALLVTAGCTIFLLAGPTASRHARAAAEGPIGEGATLRSSNTPRDHAAHSTHAAQNTRLSSFLTHRPSSVVHSDVSSRRRDVMGDRTLGCCGGPIGAGATFHCTLAGRSMALSSARQRRFQAASCREVTSASARELLRCCLLRSHQAWAAAEGPQAQVYAKIGWTTQHAMHASWKPQTDCSALLDVKRMPKGVTQNALFVQL